MHAVCTENLGKTYGNGVTGLEGLSLEIEKGTIFGLLGPNGAGKSTTVRILNGTLAPTTGTYRVLGVETSGETVRAKTATLAESAAMYDQLSVADNLEFFGTLYGMERGEIRRRSDALMERLGLEDRMKQAFGSFSTGMKKRVQLARALLHRPELVFLDEPTSGLDPESALQVVGMIRTLAQEEGTTVLLCTHNLPLAERICDAFGFLEDGRLVHAGPRDEVLAPPEGRRSLEITVRRGEDEETETCTYTDEDEINGIIRSLMDRGEVVLETRRSRVSLEDAYFRFVKRRHHELVEN